MKNTLLILATSLLLFMLGACRSSNNASTAENIADQQAIEEMETASQEIESSANTIEEKTKELDEALDDLLEDN